MFVEGRARLTQGSFALCDDNMYVLGAGLEGFFGKYTRRGVEIGKVVAFAK